MKRKTKAKVVRRGLAPSSDRLMEMHDDGYGTPAEVAAAAGVSPSTVYTWAKACVLADLNGKPATKKIGANLWVLFGAAAIKAGIGCVVCGCTDLMACPGGCSWTPGPKKVCSRCTKKGS